MSRSRAETFDALYQGAPDPWGYESSAYEREKYAATLEALPSNRYRSAAEFGCSIGVLTAQLAPRCDRLVAIDVSSVALAAAQARVGESSVSFLRGEIPADWPDGAFDLMLFSEILYFLTAAEVRTAARRALASLAPGGHIIVVNWLGECDTELDGDAAAEAFLEVLKESGGETIPVRRESRYRIDLFLGR